jgi:predicted dehydrogenase
MKIDRRDFAKLSALTMAWGSLPSFAQNTGSSQKPLGYAAVGLGRICDIFMRGTVNSSAAKLTGLVTGHPDTKGSKYAEMYGVPKNSIYTYETFDHIRDNKDIDFVYIGLPNSMHCEYTVRAAEAGKHVLCEKPMAISSAEAQKMIDACRKANVKLMIAYRIHYDPMWAKVKKMIDDGDLGQIEAFQGGFYGQNPPGEWRLTKKYGGGGSLLDLGIYPLNTIRYLTGEEPADYTAIVSTRDKGGRFAEVDQTVEWTMKFPSGIIASCGSSYGARGTGFLNICGENGYLVVEPAYNYGTVHYRGDVNGKQIDEQNAGATTPSQFTLEAEHFVDCIRNNKEPQSAGEEGLKDMIAMEAIYKAAGRPIA